MNQVIDSVFRILILLFSIIVHEVSHGATAYALGDDTAKNEGRLTLNPLPHIDPVGTILLPLFIGFGWAKPVPYNPYNLRNQKWGTVLVGAAGALANLFIALVFGLMIRFHAELGIIPGTPFFEILGTITFLNIILAVFNMIPFPPLDGAKVLFSVLPYRFQQIHDYLEHNWLLFIVFVFFFAQYIIQPISSFLLRAITGFGI